MQNDLVTRRTLNATPERVYAAFADPAELARWWGPAGFRNTFHAFEFATGGAWTLTMHGPDGKDYDNQCRFVELEPGRLVEIRHENAPLFTLRVELTASDDTGPGTATHLHWRQRFDDPALAAALRAVCEPANEQNLDRLADVLAGSSTRD